MQVDTDEAVKEFEEALSTFDISGMAEEMGVPRDMVEVRCCVKPTKSEEGSMYHSSVCRHTEGCQKMRPQPFRSDFS